jgi:hypothetical protein
MPNTHDQMTPEQQEGYRSLIETRGRLPGPNRIYVHNPKLAKRGAAGAHFRTGYSLSERERDRRLHHQQQMAFSINPDQCA